MKLSKKYFDLQNNKTIFMYILKRVTIYEVWISREELKNNNKKSSRSEPLAFTHVFYFIERIAAPSKIIYSRYFLVRIIVIIFNEF